jgi:hypothetical protein
MDSPRQRPIKVVKGQSHVLAQMVRAKRFPLHRHYSTNSCVHKDTAHASTLQRARQHAGQLPKEICNRTESIKGTMVDIPDELLPYNDRAGNRKVTCPIGYHIAIKSAGYLHFGSPDCEKTRQSKECPHAKKCQQWHLMQGGTCGCHP